MPFKSICTIDDIGRECSKCYKYKKWQCFARDNSKRAIKWKTSNCKVCRNKMKRAYRQRTDRKTDKIYKKYHRELYVWDLIEHNNIQYTVMEYRIKQWYLCKNDDSWYLNLSTSDNKNKKKFTLIRSGMDVPKEIKIQRIWRKIIQSCKIRSSEKYYNIIDILTQFYDENILTNTKDNEAECNESTEKEIQTL